MPSRDREEQFADWYENATQDELLKAATPAKKESLLEDFHQSRAYRDALEEFQLSELESDADIDDFDESAWYDKSKDGDDEEESEADLGEGD